MNWATFAVAILGVAAPDHTPGDSIEISCGVACDHRTRAFLPLRRAVCSSSGLRVWPLVLRKRDVCLRGLEHSHSEPPGLGLELLNRGHEKSGSPNRHREMHVVKRAQRLREPAPRELWIPA